MENSFIFTIYLNCKKSGKTQFEFEYELDEEENQNTKQQQQDVMDEENRASLSSDKIEEYDYFFQMAQQSYEKLVKQNKKFESISVNLNYSTQQKKLKISDLVKVVYKYFPILTYIQVHFEEQNPKLSPYTLDFPFNFPEFQDNIQNLNLSFYEEDEKFDLKSLEENFAKLKNLKCFEIVYLTKNVSKKLENFIKNSLENQKQIEKFTLIDQSNTIFQNVFPQINFYGLNQLKKMDLCYRFQEEKNKNVSMIDKQKFESGFQNLGNLNSLESLTLQNTPIVFPEQKLTEILEKIVKNVKDLTIQDTYYDKSIQNIKDWTFFEKQLVDCGKLEKLTFNAGSDLKNQLINFLFLDQNSFGNLQEFTLSLVESENSQVSLNEKNVIDFVKIFEKFQQSDKIQKISIDFYVYCLDLLEQNYDLLKESFLKPFKNLVENNSNNNKKIELELKQFQFEDFYGKDRQFIIELFLNFMKSNIGGQVRLLVPDNQRFSEYLDQYYDIIDQNSENNNNKNNKGLQEKLEEFYGKFEQKELNAEQSMENEGDDNEWEEEGSDDDDEDFEDEDDE